MSNEIRLKAAYGSNEWGLADTPRKISGVAISRIIIGESSGCSRCFPHGYEVVNSHIRNQQRSWKKHRRYQWKPVLASTVL